MADDLAAFSTACKQAAKDLRRMPKDLRAELKTVVSDDVAQWLMQRIQNRASGVERRLVYKTKKGEEPTVSIGGASRVTSGGAKGRELVYGYEFGGGTRRTTYRRRSSRGRMHTVTRRRTTRQFLRPDPFIYPTIRSEWAEIGERWIAALDPILEKWEAGE